MGYRAQSDDTSPSADHVVVESWARLDAAGKLARVRALCRQANELALAGLRLRHPGESDAELRQRLIAIRLGSDLFGRANRHRSD